MPCLISFTTVILFSLVFLFFSGIQALCDKNFVPFSMHLQSIKWCQGQSRNLVNTCQIYAPVELKNWYLNITLINRILIELTFTVTLMIWWLRIDGLYFITLDENIFKMCKLSFLVNTLLETFSSHWDLTLNYFYCLDCFIFSCLKTEVFWV